MVSTEQIIGAVAVAQKFADEHYPRTCRVSDTQMPLTGPCPVCDHPGVVHMASTKTGSVPTGERACTMCRMGRDQTELLAATLDELVPQMVGMMGILGGRA